MFSGNYFSYGDVNSEQYELMIAIIDSEENTKIGGTLEYTIFFNNDGKSEIVHSGYPEDTFSFDIEMCRTNDRPIEFAEHQSICRDFFNAPCFKKMQILDGEYNGLYFYAYITEVEKIVSGAGIIGYRGTVVCNSSYMWEDKKYTYTLNGQAKAINLYNHTLLPFYTNVDLNITIGSAGGNCSIRRITDDGKECLVSFTNVPAGSTIALTHNPKIIVCSNAAYQADIYSDNGNWNKKWLTLLQGNNKLQFNGDILSATLSYQIAKAVF